VSVAYRLYGVRQSRVVVVGNVRRVSVKADDPVVYLLVAVPEELVKTGVVLAFEVR
jgi:hypothetical protein